MLIAAWNGLEEGGTYNTVKYAQKKKKPIRYLGLALPKGASRFDSLCVMPYQIECCISYEEQKEKDKNPYKLALKAMEQAQRE